MRYIIFLFLFVFSLFGGEFKLKHWENGLTFGAYLNKYNIDATTLFKKIAPDDMRFLSSIEGDAPYFENVKDGELQETLIPLGEEMQIYIYKDNNGYSFDIVPIKYKIINDTVTVNIEYGCYNDLKKAVNNPHLATYLKRAFKDAVDFTKLQKGDSIVIKYSQKSIAGIAWGEPTIKAALIRHKGKDYFAVKNKDSYKLYTSGELKSAKKETKKEVKIVKKSSSIRFAKPLSNMRITSKFTYKRWHPILHRYRPHLGTDLGARRGTPIYAVASGKVIYAGWMRGYGKVVKIDHGNGYVSLYAHQSKIYVKAGQRVRVNQKIGAVGSTGRSTGPHLHFGMYKRGRPINPMRVINKTIKTGTIVRKVIVSSKNIDSTLTKREKRVYNSLKQITSKKNPFVWKSVDEIIEIKIKKESKSDNGVKLRSKQGAAWVYIKR